MLNKLRSSIVSSRKRRRNRKARKQVVKNMRRVLKQISKAVTHKS